MLDSWFERHQHPVSFWLHMLGIPACFLAAPALAVVGAWELAIYLFLGGYALQFLGHCIEGNPSGEEELLRRVFTRRNKGTNA